jgi:hypothetical protein
MPKQNNPCLTCGQHHPTLQDAYKDPTVRAIQADIQWYIQRYALTMMPKLVLVDGRLDYVPEEPPAGLVMLQQQLKDAVARCMRIREVAADHWVCEKDTQHGGHVTGSRGLGCGS